MLRTAKLLALTLPVVLYASACSDECSSPKDCTGGQVCYRGFCQDGKIESLSCAIDEDCIAEPSGGGPRAFICVATRCVANPNVLNNVPDTGLPPMDTGILPDAEPDTGVIVDTGVVNMDAMTPDLGTPDTGTSTIGDAGTSTVGDAGTSTVTDGG